MTSQWFKDALIVLSLMGLYVIMCILYNMDLINSFVFITFLLLLFLIFIGLYFIYRKETKVVRKYVFSIVIVILLLIYEYRLIYYEPYTYIANSVAKPIEVAEGSGIHILTVRSFEVPYIDDENLIIETYERQFQPVISLEKITNMDRYRSKNTELMSMLRLKKDDFATMGENVAEYLGGDTAAIDDFLYREDIDGNSAGLGLALSALVNKLELTNNLDFGVTGALNPSGEVLAVGGIKGKLISSEESEFPYVILPSTNKEEAVEVKEEQGLTIELISVSHIDEAIRVIKDLNNKKK